MCEMEGKGKKLSFTDVFSCKEDGIYSHCERLESQGGNELFG